MENNLYDYEMEPEKRSSFLTWLCILTFIGSSWTVVSSIFSYTTAHKTATEFSRNFGASFNDSTAKADTAGATFQRDHSPLGERMKGSISRILKEDNIRAASLGGLIAALLTLTGAILMWQLKRKGFYFYVGGVAVGILTPFYIFGNDLLAVGASSFSNFFGLIFIALYALNLKSLK